MKCLLCCAVLCCIVLCCVALCCIGGDVYVKAVFQVVYNKQIWIVLNYRTRYLSLYIAMHRHFLDHPIQQKLIKGRPQEQVIESRNHFILLGKGRDVDYRSKFSKNNLKKNHEAVH